MKIPIRRRIALAGIAVLVATVLAVLVLSGRAPDRVWLRFGAVGGFFEAPDGADVPYGATMQDPCGEWAYYYHRPSRVRELLASAGLALPLTVDFVATGRETTTASGQWREFRRCSSDELGARIKLSAQRRSSNRRLGGPSYNN